MTDWFLVRLHIPGNAMVIVIIKATQFLVSYFDAMNWLWDIYLCRSPAEQSEAHGLLRWGRKEGIGMNMCRDTIKYGTRTTGRWGIWREGDKLFKVHVGTNTRSILEVEGEV